jgi:hypothetical protein
MTVLWMLAQVASSSLTVALQSLSLLSRNIGSCGWRGHFSVLMARSGRGVGYSVGDGSNILMVALSKPVQFARIDALIATLQLLAGLPRNIGSCG